MVTIAEIQAFFFRAMVSGYASGGKKTKVLDMPGYKDIVFREGDLLLRDRYCENSHSPKSAGTTTIWFQDEPVWVMNFGGYYEADAIGLLKSALTKTYTAGQFVGGRGPAVHMDGLFILYINQPRINLFDKFEGREEIFNTASGVSMGFHEYWGMSLL